MLCKQPKTNTRRIHITIVPLCLLRVEGHAFHFSFDWRILTTPQEIQFLQQDSKKVETHTFPLSWDCLQKSVNPFIAISFKGGKQDTTMTAQNKVPLIWKEKSHPTRFRELSIDTIEIKSDLCFALILMKSSQICVLWGLVLRPITMQSLALNPLFLQSFQWLHTFQAHAVKRLTILLTYTNVEKLFPLSAWLTVIYLWRTL